MNKTIKKAAVTLVAGFALLGAGGTALAASGYIQWGGSQAKDTTLVTLQEIAKLAGQIKAEKETVSRENEQLGNAIKDRDNQLAAKQKEIDALKNSSGANSDQLKQAEQDMKEIDQKAKDVLNGLK